VIVNKPLSPSSKTEKSNNPTQNHETKRHSRSRAENPSDLKENSTVKC